MSALEVFGFDGHDVRVVMVDGLPRFVARDVASALGYADPTSAIKQHCRGVAVHHPITDSLGRPQLARVIGEPDLLRLITGSRLPQAEQFERWAFEEVLPTVIRTGSYAAPAPALPQSYAEALRELAATVERAEVLETANAALTPRAEAWDELADAGTDYAVGDAAKILQRAGVQTGPQRLFEQLDELGWIFRGGDRRWRAYSTAVHSGYLAERAQPPRRDPASGEFVPVAPQVRVTARGLERLRVRLGALALT
ncbi:MULTISPECIES: phage antirepressor KilAC domain-containing protein [Bacteria]|uniref:phage antirepressor KilAC domain-containing protein n=1 Tax=Bacteria TaxID=2 RepID=UPI003C7B61AA